jgi:membrane protein implicated in regulation of membrane protease activity
MDSSNLIFSVPILWWLGFGTLVAAELVTGTFYLLMLSIGFAAGAVAAHLQLPLTVQIVSAAVIGIGTTVAWHLRRMRVPRAAPAESNRDVNLDIGQTLHVGHWAADGSARVHYRGAQWTVLNAGPGAPEPGEHVVVAVQGSALRVAPAPRH